MKLNQITIWGSRHIFSDVISFDDIHGDGSALCRSQNMAQSMFKGGNKAYAYDPYKKE